MGLFFGGDDYRSAVRSFRDLVSTEFARSLRYLDDNDNGEIAQHCCEELIKKFMEALVRLEERCGDISKGK